MHSIPITQLSATSPQDRLKQLAAVPSEPEIADWAEVTEAIATLAPDSIQRWKSALNERFQAHSTQKRELWNRLSDRAQTALKTGGAA